MYKSKLQMKLEDLIINKLNVVKRESMVNEQVKEDTKNIDLDKIKKYFETMVHEKHFLNNYGRAKMRN